MQSLILSSLVHSELRNIETHHCLALTDRLSYRMCEVALVFLVEHAENVLLLDNEFALEALREQCDRSDSLLPDVDVLRVVLVIEDELS